MSNHSGGRGIRKEVLVKVKVQPRRKKARPWLQQEQGSAKTEGQCTYVQLKKCDKQAKCPGCEDCCFETDDSSWY